MASVHTEPALKKVPGRNSLANKAWLVLEKKHNILEKINNNGSFVISSKEIDTVREARLMAKFDHYSSQPEFFRSNNIQILPIKNGMYVLGRFNLFHGIEPFDGIQIKRNSASLSSLSLNEVTSESSAIHLALHSGVFSDFLKEKKIVETDSGKHITKNFDFNITTDRGDLTMNINKTQIEVDTVLESKKSITIIEAKAGACKDFNVRQLYYPYRYYLDNRTNVKKNVRCVFFCYDRKNHVVALHEYCFRDKLNPDSIELVKQQEYQLI